MDRAAKLEIAASAIRYSRPTVDPVVNPTQPDLWTSMLMLTVAQPKPGARHSDVYRQLATPGVH
jgi:hypothetical protein